MIVCAFLNCVLAVTAQGADKPVKVDPTLLVGTWEVVKAGKTPVGSTVEFGGSGKFTSMPKSNTMSGYIGTYKVEGSQVTIDPAGMSITVTELTGTKLVIDGLGDVIEYKKKGHNAGMVRAVPRPGGITLGAPPRAAAPGRWPVIASKEYGYTVEMPGQPNGRENGSGDGFEVRGISYQNRTMELVVTATRGPTDVPADPKALVEIREKAVGRYGKLAKLVSEKTVRAGSVEGQEFEQAIDRMGSGPMNVRGRVFARGNTAYVLLALPMGKGQALPADAQKFLDSFSLAGGSEAAKPSPRGPRPAAKAGKAWGNEVDPDDDVEVTISGPSLTMDVPGKPHVLAPERDKMNAPRVVAPTRGDFVATVQVDGKFNPGKASTVKGLSPRLAGGLIVWKDTKNYLVFQHRASEDDGKVLNQAVLEEIEAGGKGVSHRQPAPEGAVYLRLERRKGRIAASFSGDGKTWKDLKPVDAPWAEGELQVGVVAVSTSTAPHSFTFEGYSLKAR